VAYFTFTADSRSGDLLNAIQTGTAAPLTCPPCVRVLEVKNCRSGFAVWYMINSMSNWTRAALRIPSPPYWFSHHVFVWHPWKWQCRMNHERKKECKVTPYNSNTSEAQKSIIKNSICSGKCVCGLLSKRSLRRVSGPEKDEITGGGRKSKICT
jgi:hypothetical protein